MFRMNRLQEDGRYLIVPMDHGVTIGPVKGLTDINAIVKEVSEGGATAILGHKGFLSSLEPEYIDKGTGVILHLSGSTSFGPDPNYKVLVASIEDALVLGVDGVSIHVNVGGSPNEPKMLRDLGKITTEAHHYDIPVLAMMYARGENVTNSTNPKIIAHAVRIGMELDADIIKCQYSGDPKTFKKEVVAITPRPIVIAGGSKSDNIEDFFKMVVEANEAGVAGISVGRNIWQHREPKLITEVVGRILFDNYDLQEAMNYFNDKKLPETEGVRSGFI